MPIFFIFLVSNLGGLLTPLGDPPLFLGFLRGVDFFWTLRLWPHWLLANGTVLGLFFLWDSWTYWREPRGGSERGKKCESGSAPASSHSAGFRLRGLINLLFLAGILVAVLLQSDQFAMEIRTQINRFFLCPDLKLERPWGSVAMAALALLSLLLTPRGLRKANGFGWHAIVEVAVLFAGIFITMVPALDLLAVHGKQFGLTEPWQFFWLTGGLSSFLDNAPTYLTFGTLAAGSTDLSKLVHNQIPGLDGPLVLAAISCGAVFMGAMTYIGNGPNFMVRAIAEENGYQTPSFFGYMVYSVLLLLPTFGAVTYLFFWP